MAFLNQPRIQKTISLIVAATKDTRGIGRQGTIPWRISKDLTFFKDVTTRTVIPGLRNGVIMGSRTWESIPEKMRPLPGRLNVVLTEHKDPGTFPKQVHVASSLTNALKWLEEQRDVDQIFCIGGESVYRACLALPECQRIYYTQVSSSDQSLLDCDTFFPNIPKNFQLVNESPMDQTADGKLSFNFQLYERTPERATAPKDLPAHPEHQYLQLVRDVMEHGIEKADRTGVGTRSLFGATTRWSLRDNRFPLLTTKRVFWRGVLEELLWFISGKTNAKLLSDKGVRIWDGNGSRDYLDSIGLTHREEGDLGPVYGFQWRHFGAEYKTMHDSYAGQGVDQLKACIDAIRNDPNSRRIVMSAWNPKDLGQMALPPCHMFCQFYVAQGELSCHMYQRSADLGLGVPFNIASYSLLVYMMAHVTGLKPGDFVHTLGDLHVYKNHFDGLRTQLEREPRPFPTLQIKRPVKEIDDFHADDFVISEYDPHPSVRLEMAV